MPPQSFTKRERLKSRKSIQLLFEEGRSIHKYPIKLVYSVMAEDPNYATTQFAFSVPKRLFKRAVDRNLLKRRMREVYRLNKQDLQEKLNNRKLRIEAILVYNSYEALDFKSIQSAFLYLIQKLELSS
jgi:ribonuclease P protein component